MRMMMMMQALREATPLLLVLCVLFTQCSGSSSAGEPEVVPTITTECTTGGACFPDGQLPDPFDYDVTDTNVHYYCCPQRNMTAKADKMADDTYNCSCVLDLSLPGKILAWAESTRDRGRMCQPNKCEGTGVSTTIAYRYHYCCPDNGAFNVTSEVTTFDSDKPEFIGCRCTHLPVPTPLPRAYTVPPVEDSYNSTGESCSYDAECQDGPSLQCQSLWPSNVTFCCYGSRGMVTSNHGDALTLCTCTDEVFGAQCQADPVAISDSTLPCLSHCPNRTSEDTCRDSHGGQRCCPHNMAVVASQSQGSFTSCVCKGHHDRGISKVNTCNTHTSTGEGDSDQNPASRATCVAALGGRWGHAWVAVVVVLVLVGTMLG